MAETNAPEPIAKLIDTLQSGSTRDKRKAAAELAGFGPDAQPAMPALIYCLGDEDAALRVYAGEALSKIGPAATPELIHALRNRNDEVRQVVVRALAALDIKTDKLLETLTNCLRDVDTTVRMDAANALVKAGKPAVPHLIEGLKDEDPGFRKACCVTLGAMGTTAKPALAAIVQAVQDGRLGPEAGDTIQAIHGNFLAVLVRFLQVTLIRSHITIVAILLFAALVISLAWLATKVLNVTLAVVAVVLSWGVIGMCLGAALGYWTRWKRIGAIVGAVVMGLGGATSGAMVGETFVRISEGVVRGLLRSEPKTKTEDQAQDDEKPDSEPDSPLPIPKP